MSTYTYPDGSQLLAPSALTDDLIQKVFQNLTCQMLGILIAPWEVQFTLAAGQSVAQASSPINLYYGQLIDCTGVSTATSITGFGSDGSVFMSSPAIASGTSTGSVTDPKCYYKVRVGWQQLGQPAWAIDEDTCIIRCATVPSDYSETRDLTNTAGDTTVTQSDTFTRCWKTFWTFYGPNSIDRARAVRSALMKIDFVAYTLAQSNLYLIPDISEPLRSPEDFQGQWWERVDMTAIFNEQVNEQYVVNAIASVEVIGFTENGQFTDFTVQL